MAKGINAQKKESFWLFIDQGDSVAVAGVKAGICERSARAWVQTERIRKENGLVSLRTTPTKENQPVKEKEPLKAIPPTPPIIEKQTDVDAKRLEFLAEYRSTMDLELAAHRCGINKAEAGHIVVRYLLALEEAETRRKNALPKQALAKELPKIWKTKPDAFHMVIPDVQVKPGQDWAFLERVGQDIANKMPDVIVQIGDFDDMPSLASFDIGKRKAEGKRYELDIMAGKEAMARLMGPIQRKMREVPTWKPLLILTLGNHEHRITRAAEDNPALYGKLSLSDMGYEEFGWIVYPFLEVVNVDGINYCHYFTSGPMGRPVGTARMLLQKKHQSCVQGHIQGMQIHTEPMADGSVITGLFVSCCYEHDEDYLTPQGNNYYRGIWSLYEINNGELQFKPTTLKHLKNKYAHIV